tara:strand:- start:406 stop:798 length:393 start_codon:yes stop_codon:yes gene_type:complete
MTTLNSLINKIIKFVKKREVYLTIFYTFAYSWYGVYFLALTRISENAYEYLEEITFFYKLFVACLLIYLFNPFSKNRYNKRIHKRIIFTAAIFLITTEGLENIFDKIKETSDRFLILPKILLNKNNKSEK